MRRPAFTLLELLLVLGIIIMIAGLGITGYQRQYARSEFKNGVVQLQVDLSLARLLAMHTGNTYVFRYAPGSGVYEIAPLKTLQETIYRMNGDFDDENDSDALGGSLIGGGLNSTPSTSAFGLGGSSTLGLPGTTVYTDDLFSPENVAADMAYAAQANAREARAGTTNVDLTGGLGGSLTSAPGAPLGYDSALGGTGFDSTSGYASPYDYSTDYSGTGGEFSMGSVLGYDQSQAPLTTLRELDSTEKLLADERTLASRVNLDGVVIRKQASGNVIFTFMRLSDSTPTKLKARRSKGVKNDSADPVTGIDEGEDLGSVLGGSLLSIPSGTSGEGLGGGLNSIPGYEDEADPLLAATLEEERGYVSLWSEPLLFFPNGKTSNAILGFASVGEYSFYSEIALRGMTGVARISGVSGIPPDMDPNQTALTREQLMRLQNPGLAYSGDETLGASVGGALGSSSKQYGALGASQNDLYDANELYGVPTGVDDAFGGDLNANANSYAPAYGSSDRRSGYRFDESSSGLAAPLGTTPGAPDAMGTGAFGDAVPATSGFPAANAPGGGAGFGTAGSGALNETPDANPFGAIDAATSQAVEQGNAATRRERQDQDDLTNMGGSL
ncbi:MAG: hypothetical protein IJM54_07095 [Thermoguttaceae bacterium]|nr:hypothetical protein [Thermoguttaceae bacterium]